MSEAVLSSCRGEIARRLRMGSRLADVEGELIESRVDLSEEESAALWLYAWAASETDEGELLGQLPSG